MKLNRLRISSFVGVPEADIEFKSPVTLFAGRNNQGKSSIKDAVEFVFEGKCRAMKYKKDVDHVMHGNNGMAVEVDYIDGQEEANFKRTKSNVNTDLGGSGILHYCLNPADFIELPAKERAKILAEVLGGGMDELVKEAIIKHIGNFDPTLLADVKASGVNVLDVDALRKEVVDCRRAYKRTLQELQVKPPLLGDYELDHDYKVEADENEVKALGIRISNGGDLIAEARRMVVMKVELVEVNKRLEQVKGLIKKVPKLPSDYDEMAPVYCSIIDNLLTSTKNATINCPLAGTAHKRESLEARHKELSEYLKRHLAAIAEHDKVKRENAEYEAEQKRLEERKKDLNQNLKPINLPDGSENLLENLTAERDKLQTNIANYRRFEKALQDNESARKKADQLVILIAECDRIDEALKDGGPVKAAIAAGGRKLPINDKLLEAWGIPSLTWSDTGEISLTPQGASGPVAIEYASKSERQRAACVMGLALAEVSGIGIAAIDDELESLDEPNRNAFFGAVTECHLSNVLVCASTNKDYSQVQLPDWLEVYQVEGGKVSRVS